MELHLKTVTRVDGTCATGCFRTRLNLARTLLGEGIKRKTSVSLLTFFIGGSVTLWPLRGPRRLAFYHSQYHTTEIKVLLPWRGAFTLLVTAIALSPRDLWVCLFVDLPRSRGAVVDNITSIETGGY